MLYKRYKGKRIKNASDPNWQKASWVLSQRIQGQYIHKSLRGARSENEARLFAAAYLRQYMEKELDAPQIQIDEYVRTRLRRVATRVTHFVYIVESRGFYKIGMSSNVTARFKVLAKDALPSESVLIMSVRTKNGRTLEKRMHERYAKHRLVGEWFQFTAEELEEVKAYLLSQSYDRNLPDSGMEMTPINY